MLYLFVPFFGEHPFCRTSHIFMGSQLRQRDKISQRNIMTKIVFNRYFNPFSTENDFRRDSDVSSRSLRKKSQTFIMAVDP